MKYRREVDVTLVGCAGQNRIKLIDANSHNVFVDIYCGQDDDASCVSRQVR